MRAVGSIPCPSRPSPRVWAALGADPLSVSRSDGPEGKLGAGEGSGREGNVTPRNVVNVNPLFAPAPKPVRTPPPPPPRKASSGPGRTLVSGGGAGGVRRLGVSVRGVGGEGAVFSAVVPATDACYILHVKCRRSRLLGLPRAALWPSLPRVCYHVPCVLCVFPCALCVVLPCALCVVCYHVPCVWCVRCAGWGRPVPVGAHADGGAVQPGGLHAHAGPLPGPPHRTRRR